MIIGYARVSTHGQSLESQLEQLKEAGVEKAFKEKVSGKDSDRFRLQEMLSFIDEGDMVIVTKLDRLARSTKDLLQIAEIIEKKGADLKVLNAQIDTSTPTGKLTFTVLGAIATFEREMMLERQREGIDRAKAAGKYQGRQPTAKAKTDAVLADIARGVSKAQTARNHDISVRSVFRIFKDAQKSKAKS